jgi:hypothetical protein
MRARYLLFILCGCNQILGINDVATRSGTDASGIDASPSDASPSDASPSDASPPDAPMRRLTLQITGTGSGTFTIQPTGAQCHGGCTVSLPIGATPMITFAQDAGSFFVDWSGGCAGTAMSCTVPTGTDTVTANVAAVHEYLFDTAAYADHVAIYETGGSPRGWVAAGGLNATANGYFAGAFELDGPKRWEITGSSLLLSRTTNLGHVLLADSSHVYEVLMSTGVQTTIVASGAFEVAYDTGGYVMVSNVSTLRRYPPGGGTPLWTYQSMSGEQLEMRDPVGATNGDEVLARDDIAGQLALHTVARANGARISSVNLPGYVGYRLSIGSDGSEYVLALKDQTGASQLTRVHAGTVEWTVDVDGNVSELAVGTRIYIAGESSPTGPWLEEIDPASGAARWHRSLPIKSCFMYSDGPGLAADSAGNLYVGLDDCTSGTSRAVVLQLPVPQG